MKFLKEYGELPSEIHIVTQPAWGPPWFGTTISPTEYTSSFLGVVRAIVEFFGSKSVNSLPANKACGVTGYKTKDWASQSTLAVDPKAGTFARL
jgi:hypothetical protein